MKTLTLLILLLIGISGYSQTYNVSITNSPYVSISGGELLVHEAWDAPVFALPIGFSFPFFDDVIDTLFSQDFFAGGYLSTSLDYFSTGIIDFFSTDLIDRGYEIDSSMSPIWYKSEGELGHRVFTLEFQNAGFYGGEVNNDIYTDHINIQLRLREETEDIEVHIGPYSTLNPGLDFEGVTGPNIGLIEDFNFEDGSLNGENFILAGDPLNPDIITDFSPDWLEWPIPENTVYIFSRNSTNTEENQEPFNPQYYFPNPASNYLTLNQVDQTEIISAVRIMDVIGNTVAIVSEIEHIDINHLASGIYALHFETTSGFVNQRISIIK